ncbi:MAG: transglutaminase domain-containing protein [Oscillospiraceae bacterium]|nr:transglutaminase domain-containing protein [Oscillospiraceae bacterium]
MCRKLIALVMLAVMLFSLCGCSSMYDREYVHISEYSSPEQSSSGSDGKLTVRNFNALKQAILNIVYSESGEGKISFDSSYEGDAVEDMASACWQVRTQDAMCAYCVENIAYEMNKIVSHYEAELSVTYSNVIQETDGIIRMQYATGLDDTLTQAISQSRKKLALLVVRSSYNADEMIGKVEALYRENPSIAPQMPKVDVKMFSGNSMQKLYEINLDYGLNDHELKKRRSSLNAVRPFDDLEIDSMSQIDRLLLACQYLAENCIYGSETAGNSVYSALVIKDADSEGLSYAFVELCRQLGIECTMIYGQRNWQDHWWNIVKLDEGYYHVDMSLCMDGEFEDGFLLNDQHIWGAHRWDVSSYPACSGEPLYNVDVQETDIE